VKRIWTPAWTLFSGGLCFLLLAGFSWVIDVKGYRRWSFPLVVVGMNSIAAYLIAHLFDEFIRQSFKTHLGMTGLIVGPFVLLTYFAILLWMYRRKIFLRI
jgi:predicted acyltransferase